MSAGCQIFHRPVKPDAHVGAPQMDVSAFSDGWALLSIAAVHHTSTVHMTISRARALAATIVAACDAADGPLVGMDVHPLLRRA